MTLPNINFTGLYPGPGLWSLMDVYRRAGAFLPTQATGGTVTEIEQAGLLWRVHSFTAVGTATFDVTFVSELVPTAEYLVVAGGGGGGSSSTALANNSGGGGGGGYRSSVQGESSGGGASAESPLALEIGAYTITVGGGGAGGANDSTRGSQGGASSIGSLVTTVGGGGGGSRLSQQTGTSGGSGGGAGVGSGGAGTAGQGFAGGSQTAGDTGGGGGGAGGAGANNAGNCAGRGPGVASLITGTSVTRARGGQARCFRNTGTETANSGNGGDAVTNNPVQAGVTGGSGIVIIRYPIGTA